MKLCSILLLCPTIAIYGCGGGRGTSICATPLIYSTNPHTLGQQAISDTSTYYAGLLIGADGTYVEAKLDTASSDLVINESNYTIGSQSRLGTSPFEFKHQENNSFAFNAMDKVQVGCSFDTQVLFDLSSEQYSNTNILGLAFGDEKKLPQEAGREPFFDQLVRKSNFNNLISLALCGHRGGSHVLFGGIDDVMSPAIGKFVPIIERSSYVVPALTLRRTDNKKIIGTFPTYDAATQTGKRTIIDSASSFNLLPTRMATAMAKEVALYASERNFKFFPKDFFRTERAVSTKLATFANIAQIKQFPSFEITFWGTDGKIKALELDPEHYFKEIDGANPLIRTFAIRDTDGEALLGQPFIENHYIVFDRHEGRIGFGNIDAACE